MSAYFEIARENDKRIDCFILEQNQCEPHFHSNLEMIYQLEGETEATINGKTRTLRPGEVSIAGSYDVHRYASLGTTRAILLIIPVSLVPSFALLAKGKTFTKHFLEDGEAGRQIREAAERLVVENGRPEPLVSKGYAYAILGILSRELGLGDQPKTGSTDLAREILVYLEQHYLEDLNIEKLARGFGYNKDYLSRFFNSYLGCGFNRYLNLLRSRHAARLIDQTNQPLTDIAFQSGFGNYRTFNRAFSAAFGITPRDYKTSAARGT